MTDPYWPGTDLYNFVPKGRPAATRKPPPPVTVSVSDGAAGGGKVTVSISPATIEALGWEDGDALYLAACETPSKVFLRLVPSSDGEFPLKSPPKMRVDGAPSRKLVHLGRCGGLKISPRRSEAVKHRVVEVERRSKSALELVIDSDGVEATSPRRRPKPSTPPLKRAAEALSVVHRPSDAAEAAAMHEARELRGSGHSDREILHQLKTRQHWVADQAWLNRVFGRTATEAAA